MAAALSAGNDQLDPLPGSDPQAQDPAGSAGTRDAVGGRARGRALRLLDGVLDGIVRETAGLGRLVRRRGDVIGQVFVSFARERDVVFPGLAVAGRLLADAEAERLDGIERRHAAWHNGTERLLTEVQQGTFNVPAGELQRPLKARKETACTELQPFLGQRAKQLALAQLLEPALERTEEIFALHVVQNLIHGLVDFRRRLELPRAQLEEPLHIFVRAWLLAVSALEHRLRFVVLLELLLEPLVIAILVC